MTQPERITGPDADPVAAPTPVFFDPHGGRRRWMRASGLLAALLSIAVVAAVIFVLQSPSPAISRPDIPSPGISSVIDDPGGDASDSDTDSKVVEQAKSDAEASQ